MIGRLPVRLSAKITVLADGCWDWQGAVNHKGYGLAYIGALPTTTPGRMGPAHKVVYEALVGLVPEGMQLDHTCHDTAVCGAGVCRHRRCVNPTHVEVQTPQGNTLRSGSLSALNAVKTECPNGHRYDEANTYVNPKGERNCRQCVRDRRAARSPEQIERDKQKARERAARNRAANPELHRQRWREWRERKRAS